ncbi:hypothetical protein [Bradyrhizobium sp. CCBAU 53338]|uniref:hypothetical protein n=1 Tax=Bradyrhizobium sp. CCBAU 53338 TaxID=1325111 RepID=UPI00188C7BCA|nr:hypothetical protein [Bradyrhizobium sp. CCBAU 53338]
MTRVEAAKLICEYGNAKPCIYDRPYVTFRSVELHQYSSKYQLLVTIGATVPLTEDRDADRRLAMEMIDIQIFERHSEFWPGRVSTDADFDARVQRIAEARNVQAIDRQITTELIDEFLKQGYSITCCVREDDPAFKKSKDRDGILELLMDLEIAELRLHSRGATSWIMLVFGESGWDVVADYSEDLEALIEPIVSPHAPWNKPDAGPQDRGYSVLVLPSPADLENGDPAAEKAFEDFIGLIGRLH